MVPLLTAKELQAMLQVDRSTIYRMAESQNIPAIKVGKQWRFPADRVELWLKTQSSGTSASPPAPASPPQPATVSAPLLPPVQLKLIQDGFALALGAMVQITDINGHPLVEPSKPFGLFLALQPFPSAKQRYETEWRRLAQLPALKPQFTRTGLGLLATRGIVRVGSALQGMVVIDGIAPNDWTPDVAALAEYYGVPAEALSPHLDDVYFMDSVKQALVLSLAQHIADIVAHLATERAAMAGKLNAIAQLVG